jgi:hypothetical protein
MDQPFGLRLLSIWMASPRHVIAMSRPLRVLNPSGSRGASRQETLGESTELCGEIAEYSGLFGDGDCAE